MFEYVRNIHVYETDLMGIVHHSNYLRFCEEARVEWCRSRGALGDEQKDVFGLAVIESKVKHLRPLRYADKIKIQIQVKIIGARLIFQYKIFAGNVLRCIAETRHCRMDLSLKVKRFDQKFINFINTVEKEIWTETWL